MLSSSCLPAELIGEGERCLSRLLERRREAYVGDM
jgi:hypothetical protein